MIARLTKEVIKYNAGDKKRIIHSLKVHSFAKTIGVLEKLDENKLFVLESASLLHDIGIKVCEAKYGACGGKLQEKEGPAVALPILKKLNYKQDDIDRILYLISHHHTYTNVEGADYQILIESDFIVNLEEENSSKVTIKRVLNNIFKTENGKEICKNLFDV